MKKLKIKYFALHTEKSVCNFLVHYKFNFKNKNCYIWIYPYVITYEYYIRSIIRM